MFEQLFERSDALARQRAGPLPEARERYLHHLAEQGMARKTLRVVAYYLLGAAEYLRLAERPDAIISAAELDQVAARWAQRPLRSPLRTGVSWARGRFLWYASGWLQFLGRLQPPPAEPRPYADYLAAFADYMRRERGLAPSTIQQRCWEVGQYLDQVDALGHSLHRLTPGQIDAILRQRLAEGRYVRSTVSRLADTLRAFFRFAQTRDWCPRGLAESLKGPRLFAHESLPSGPSWPDVKRLLASVEGDTPVLIRDRAILLLLAVYGFRSGEVGRLRLDDFDWEREMLRVTRSKTQQTQIYPLAHSVGDAVLRYLKEVRPRCAWREVFITRSAPIRPLTTFALWSIVSRRLRALGVALAHHGPHALRHACAAHLQEEGLSLKEIADHLGHRHPDSTRVYTKVDLGGLRQVADFDLGGLL
jgi:integrase/recombinase XerD